MASNKRKDIPEIVEIFMRSVLLSKAGGVLLRDVARDYRTCCNEELNYRKYGFDSIEEFLSAMPDVAKVVTENGVRKVFGTGADKLLILNRTAQKAVYKSNNIEASNKSQSNDPSKQGKRDVFVGNLPNFVTEVKLREHFQNYDIKAVRIVQKPSNSMAFIETTPYWAERMCEEKNGTRFLRNKIIVELAKSETKPQRQNFKDTSTIGGGDGFANGFTSCNEELRNVKKSDATWLRSASNVQHASNNVALSTNSVDAMSIGMKGVNDSVTGLTSCPSEFLVDWNGITYKSGNRTFEEIPEPQCFTKKPVQVVEYHNELATRLSATVDDNGIPPLVDIAGEDCISVPLSSTPDKFNIRSLGIQSSNAKDESLVVSSSGNVWRFSKDPPPLIELPLTYDCRVTFLDYHATYDNVKSLFSRFNPLEVIMVNPSIRQEIDYKSIGRCYVKFATLDDALEAQENCNGLNINDRPIKVELSKNTEMLFKESQMNESLQCTLGSNTDERRVTKLDKSRLGHQSSPVPNHLHNGASFENTNIRSGDSHPSTVMNRSDFTRMLQETCPGTSPTKSLDLQDVVSIVVTCIDTTNPNYFWAALASAVHNELPVELRDLTVSPVTFAKHLKTYLFRAQPFEVVFKQWMPEFESISSRLMVATAGIRRGLAKFDSEWWRVWIKSWSASAGMATVYFIDYGNTETISTNDIYILPDHYWTIPPRALPFKLSEPVNRKLDISKYVYKMVNAVLKRPGRKDHITEVIVTPE